MAAEIEKRILVKLGVIVDPNAAVEAAPVAIETKQPVRKGA